MNNLPSAILSRRNFIELALVSTGLANFSFADDKISQEMPNLKVGDKFPETKLLNKKGEELNLTEISQGKLVLVDFWGVWCAPCLQEIPKLNVAYKELNKQKFISSKSGQELADGLEIYSIAVHLEEAHHQHWRTLVDHKKTITWQHNVEAPSLEYIKTTYGVDSFPRNFLIDDQGVILMINVDIGSLQELIKKLE